jgi:hypothetical protein
MENKTCSKCKVDLPINNFGINNRTKDGFKAWCKQCSKEYMKGYRINHPELQQKEREYALNWKRTQMASMQEINAN